MSVFITENELTGLTALAFALNLHPGPAFSRLSGALLRPSSFFLSIECNLGELNLGPLMR